MIDRYVITLLSFPLALTLSAAISILIGGHASKKTAYFLSLITRLGLFIMFFWQIFILSETYFHATNTTTFHEGEWFHLGDYTFSSDIIVDKLSLTYAMVIITLCIIIEKFASRYLYGDRKRSQFYFLFNLFILSSLLISYAGNVDQLIVGWEILGITSVLLITFFNQKKRVLDNGLYVLGCYKIADIGLLLSALAMHIFYHAPPAFFEMSTHPPLAPHQTLILSLLFLWGSLGKSAQWPLIEWPGKAMEGPTPTSAIFYGAISIHFGAFLLLRCYPLLEQSLNARICIFAIGCISSLYATLVGRIKCDAKTSLAYSTVSQVGLIYIEISLGLTNLALWHIVAHSFLRTFQYLRTSSLLQEFYLNPLVFKDTQMKTGAFFELIIPYNLRKKFYYLVWNKFGLDILLKKMVHLFIAFSAWINAIDKKWYQLFNTDQKGSWK